jgi:hypothetical protein
MDRLLTDGELADLSGVEQPAAQKRWLEENGIFFYERRSDSRPRTTWYHINHPVISRSASNDASSEPDFGALGRGS